MFTFKGELLNSLISKLLRSLTLTGNQFCDQPPTVLVRRDFKTELLSFARRFVLYSFTMIHNLCLSVFLSLASSVRLSILPLICLTVSPSIIPSVHPLFYPSTRLFLFFLHPPVCPSVRPSVCPSVRPSIRLSVRLSIRSSVHPFVHRSTPSFLLFFHLSVRPCSSISSPVRRYGCLSPRLKGCLHVRFCASRLTSWNM